MPKALNSLVLSPAFSVSGVRALLGSSASYAISRDSREPLRDFSLLLVGLRRSADPSPSMLATLACLTISKASFRLLKAQTYICH